MINQRKKTGAIDQVLHEVVNHGHIKKKLTWAKYMYLPKYLFMCGKSIWNFLFCSQN